MSYSLPFPDEIKDRIKNGRGCGSQIGEGWFDLVCDLDKNIAKLAPDYTINQVKEKFGGLRYYIGAVPEDVYDEVYEIIHEAENKSYGMCEACGAPAVKDDNQNGWITTRCKKHGTS